MITELYTFTPSSYVVADEWNANFRVLYNFNAQHTEAIADAYTEIAFPTSDLTPLFNKIRSYQNSWPIPGDTVTVMPENEYYKTLTADQTLTIDIPQGLNAEARVCLYLTTESALSPISISYDGATTIVDEGGWQSFRSGYYFVLIYEANNMAQVKLLFTGA